MLHLEQFQKVYSGTGSIEICKAINATAETYQINTLRRMRYFVAQSYFETQGFRKWTEDLYYTTPSRIAQVWPTRFYSDEGGKRIGKGPLNAKDYIRNARLLANTVYSGRKDLGNTQPNDGWDFRGRGAGHLTGRGHYTNYSQQVYGNNSRVDNPDLVADYDDGVLSFGWFWNMEKLNGYADRDMFTAATGVINGSTSTAPERLEVLRIVNRAITEV